MTWADAFLHQARSDNAVRRLLNARGFEQCHELHYLQMSAEKLAKSYATPPGHETPPRQTHAALVRFLQTLKSRRDLRERLGYDNANVFRSYVDSLLPIAQQIEQLPPSAAGLNQPNPEYPWRPHNGADVIAPAHHDFMQTMPESHNLHKFVRLIEALLKL